MGLVLLILLIAVAWAAIVIVAKLVKWLLIIAAVLFLWGLVKGWMERQGSGSG